MRFCPLISILRLGVSVVGSLAFALSLACSKQSTQPAEDQGRPLAPAATRAVTAGGIALTALQSDHASLTLELRVPAGIAPPREAVFAVALPLGVNPHLQIAELTCGGTQRQWLLEDGRSTGTLAIQIDPKAAFSLSAGGYMRQWPIRELTIKSDFFNRLPISGGLISDEVRARIRCDWSSQTAQGALAAPPATPAATGTALRDVASKLVCNPEDLSRWANPTAPMAQGLAQHAPTGADQLAPGAHAWARFEVAQAALLRLQPEPLLQAGLGSDLSAIRIFREGKPVPTYRVPPPSPQAGIYLHVVPRDSVYGHTATYWVAAAPEMPDPQIPPFTLPVAPEAARAIETITRHARLDRDHVRHLEQDNLLSIRGIQWVDARLSESAPLDLPLHFRAPAAQAPVSAQLSFRVDGSPEVTTGTLLALRRGADEIGRFAVNAETPTEINLTIPAAMIREGWTTFTLAVAHSTSATLDIAEDSDDPPAASIWLDWVDVTYPARPALLDGALTLDSSALTSPGAVRFQLDPSDSRAAILGLAVDDTASTCALLATSSSQMLGWIDPQRHSEWHALASAQAPELKPQVWQPQWFADTEPFDYLIITHARFADQLEPLLKLNAARGLKTRVIDIQTVFDYFSGGALSPEAIRRLLAWLSQTQGVAAPDYVLLVGDASSDYLDLVRAGVENLVPSYTQRMGGEEWASDFWLTRIVGEDDLGDFMLGRISVNNRTDAQHAIDKLVRYSTQPQWGPWRARMAFVADNLESFREAAEDTRALTPAGIAPVRTYLDQQPLEDNWYIPARQIERIWAAEKTWMKVSGAATRKIRDTFNHGVAYLDYFGHGSPNIWTDERVWFGGDSPNRDAQWLKSDGHYAFVVNYTCNTGAIDYPMPRWNICISEDLLRQEDGGAVGLFVPSGPGTTPEHEKLAREWRRALFQDGERGAGAAALLARSRLALSGESRDLVLMYSLLGDPALRLQLVAHTGTATIDPEDANLTAQDLTLESGKALAWIQDASDNLVWQSEPWNFKGGRLKHKLTLPDLPADADPNSPRELYIYAWNEKQGVDWAAYVPHPADSPALSILDAELPPPPSAAEAAQGSRRPQVRIQNSGDANGRGRLDLERLASAASKPIVSLDVAVPAGEQSSLTLPVAIEVPVQPDVYQVRLIPSRPAPAADLAIPAEPTLRFAVYPAPGDWIALLPELSTLAQDNRGVATRLEILVAAGQTAPTSPGLALVLRSPGGEQLTSQPLVLAPEGDHFSMRAIFSEPAVLRSLDQGGDAIVIHNGVERAHAALKNVPRLAARMRIKPRTIAHNPDAPTDGDTIFIRLEVENAGNAPSGIFTPELFDGDPSAGGKPLRQQSGAPKVTVGPIGAGRSAPITLRWDPIENAGVQNIWIDLRATPGAPPDQTTEQRSAYRLFVRGKAKLARDGAPYASQNDQERLDGIYKLHCGVRNDGETEAHNVEVNFFIGPEQSDEQKIGTVHLPEVPAKGKVDAVLEWKFDPAQYPGLTRENLKPTTEIRLRGSQQRLGR